MSKKSIVKILVSFLTVLLLLMAGGCASSRPSRFYILTSMAETPEIEHGLKKADDLPLKKHPAQNNLTIGLGPVSIAKYLDRSQLVVRNSENEILLEEFKQWAGPLRDVIPGVLLENLSYLLATDKIVNYPWKSRLRPDFQVEVDIFRLDGIPGENVKLTARWRIISSLNDDVTGMGKTEMMEPDYNSDFDSFAAAQSRVLGRFCILLAGELLKAMEEFKSTTPEL